MEVLAASASVIRRRAGSLVAVARSSLMVVLMAPSLKLSWQFFCGLRGGGDRFPTQATDRVVGPRALLAVALA